MTKFNKRRFVKFAIGAMAMGALSASAIAASVAIENAKNECVVGEQADGYLGVVSGKSASGALRREVRDVNQQRKSYYADIARRNGVSTEVTATLAGEKLIGQARRGHCVRNASGAWVKK